MQRYIPLPPPPRRIAQHEETRLAVHKKVRDVIREIAHNRNQKISEVIWNAVVDHWVLRMSTLEKLHLLLSPNPALNEDVRSYVGRGIADAKHWDSKSLDEQGNLILADTGYNNDFHKKYNLRIDELLRMPLKELKLEKKRVEKDREKQGLHDEYDILPTIKAIIEDKESKINVTTPYTSA